LSRKPRCVRPRFVAGVQRDPLPRSVGRAPVGQRKAAFNARSGRQQGGFGATPLPRLRVLPGQVAHPRNQTIKGLPMAGPSCFQAGAALAPFSVSTPRKCTDAPRMGREMIRRRVRVVARTMSGLTPTALLPQRQDQRTALRVPARSGARRRSYCRNSALNAWQQSSPTARTRDALSTGFPAQLDIFLYFHIIGNVSDR
jgi:hypothetical protein